jgi:hypothetical protein
MHQRFVHEAQKAIPVNDNASLYQFRHLPVAVGLIGIGYDVNAARALLWSCSSIEMRRARDPFMSESQEWQAEAIRLLGAGRIFRRLLKQRPPWKSSQNSCLRPMAQLGGLNSAYDLDLRNSGTK